MKLGYTPQEQRELAKPRIEFVQQKKKALELFIYRGDPVKKLVMISTTPPPQLPSHSKHHHLKTEVL